MSMVEIKVPSVGESITEATVGKWNFQEGDLVEKDAVIFEIETEKATMEVNAPASGKLHIESNTGVNVAIGAVVGTIDTSAAISAGSPSISEAPSGPPLKPPPGAPPSAKPSVAPPVVAPPVTKPSVTVPPVAATNIAATVTPVKLPPTPPPAYTPPVALSPDGHVSPQPALRGVGPAQRKAIREGRVSLPTVSPSLNDIEPSAEGVRRVPMSVIRKKIAERLMHSQSSTATLTTFNEVDMSNIIGIRNQLKDEFLKRHGVKLGFMSFFSRAICFAAPQVPTLNAFVEGNDILYHENIHMGVAVSTDRGLVVPVIRSANKKSYADLEKDIFLMAEKARTGKLGIEDMLGGTFTLTNGGVFGSLLSTPILNPPQSGILGMHKTEFRPVAIDKNGTWSVEVRPMMYLALSYDHRLVDGRDSVTFLVKVKEYLETVSAEEVMRG